MKNWFLLVTALAIANAVAADTLPPPVPLKTRNYIEGCKTKLTKLPSRLHIVECDGPLQLNSTTFKYINKPFINVLSIENIIIKQIEENAFKDFKNIDDVVVSNTRIGSIDAKAFSNVKKLKFYNCGFEDSPDFVSDKLEELTFGQCQLEEIPNLSSLMNLIYLNLSGNYIKNIEIETFAQLDNLEELHLSNNEIFKLPPTIFINNQALSSLTLDNNPLRRFYLNTSESLEYLSLNNCNLEVFDERSTQRLSTLNELILSGNHIKELSSKTLANMKQLSIINLANNRLEKLDDDIFANHKELIKITLNGNRLKTLPNFKLADNSYFSIYSISCRNCGLRYLSPSVFQNMASMITLDLSHNNFNSFEGVFDKIESLKYLDISYNNISKIAPKTFSFNRNLETLNLAGNPLKVLEPEVFSKNRVLREIDARNSSLKKLWSNNNSSVEALHRIYLANNHLTNLTFEDFRVMPTLEGIELNNNPLVFGEYLCRVIQWLRLNGVSPIENATDQMHFEGFDKTYGEDFDSFHSIEWKDLHQKQCSDYETTDSDFYENNYDGEGEEDDMDNDDDDTYDDDDDDDSYNDDEATDEFLKKTVHKKFEQWPFAEDDLTSENNNRLANASYILSIGSVFILSALVVLTLAVTITLWFMRRSNNFNMHTANLPRLKIPLWTTTPNQKKHSGSVYRPLSEDLSGPKTPKLSRYDFAATPTVHTANP